MAQQQPPATQRKGVVFRAIPDTQLVPMQPDGKGFIQPVWPNNTVIPPQMFTTLAQQAPMLWFPAPPNLPLKGVEWVVNMCADEDEYAGALGWLEARMKDWDIRKVFNDPREVRKTRRDRIADLLEGTDNLIVPKCLRFQPKHPDDFRKAFAEGGFSYPVLVRVARTQSGKTMLKIDSDKGWDAIYTIPWGGQPVYMTQFVDFRGADGDYAKLRVTIVGDSVVLRHVHFADDWKVHYSAPSVAKVTRELDLIRALSGSETLNRIVAAIKGKVRLDFWGIDLGYVSGSDDFVFFEANAAMSMAPTGRRQGGIARPADNDAARKMKSSIGKSVNEKLNELLFAPDTWAMARATPAVLV